jgi:hypothetical protein
MSTVINVASVQSVCTDRRNWAESQLSICTYVLRNGLYKRMRAPTVEAGPPVSGDKVLNKGKRFPRGGVIQVHMTDSSNATVESIISGSGPVEINRIFAVQATS